jgi:hypothetical protein
VNSNIDVGQNTETTDLYLVRIWKRKSSDGTRSLHGKLQHAVSGASCHFEGLAELPQALSQMLAQSGLWLDTEPESLSPQGSEPDPNCAPTGQ